MTNGARECPQVRLLDDGESETTTGAALALRGLIDCIRLVPVNGTLEIELEGARAALLALGLTCPGNLPPV